MVLGKKYFGNRTVVDFQKSVNGEQSSPYGAGSAPNIADDGDRQNELVPSPA